MASGDSNKSLNIKLKQSGKSGNWEKKFSRMSAEQILKFKEKAGISSSNNSSNEPSIFNIGVSNSHENRQENCQMCPIMESETNQITQNVAPKDLVDKPSCLFYFQTQNHANEDILSINVGKENYVLPNKPNNETLISYLTKGKVTGNGLTLGQTRLTNDGQTLDFGMKIENLNNLKHVLLGSGELRLVRAQLPSEILAGGDSSQSSARKFIHTLIDGAYGLELTHSSPSGQHKANPNDKPPLVKMHTFPLEAQKIELIVNIVKRKYKEIMVGREKIQLDKKATKVRTLVYEIIRKEATKVRTPLIKNAKRKAEEDGIHVLGFYPKKERIYNISVKSPTKEKEIEMEDIDENIEAALSRSETNNHIEAVLRRAATNNHTEAVLRRAATNNHIEAGLNRSATNNQSSLESNFSLAHNTQIGSQSLSKSVTDNQSSLQSTSGVYRSSQNSLPNYQSSSNSVTNNQSSFMSTSGVNLSSHKSIPDYQSSRKSVTNNQSSVQSTNGVYLSSHKSIPDYQFPSKSVTNNQSSVQSTSGVYLSSHKSIPDYQSTSKCMNNNQSSLQSVFDVSVSSRKSRPDLQSTSKSATNKESSLQLNSGICQSSYKSIPASQYSLTSNSVSEISFSQPPVSSNSDCLLLGQHSEDSNSDINVSNNIILLDDTMFEFGSNILIDQSSLDTNVDLSVDQFSVGSIFDNLLNHTSVEPLGELYYDHSSLESFNEVVIDPPSMASYPDIVLDQSKICPDKSSNSQSNQLANMKLPENIETDVNNKINVAENEYGNQIAIGENIQNYIQNYDYFTGNNEITLTNHEEDMAAIASIAI